MKNFIVGLLALVILSGCTRIESGQVGLRVGFDKQVHPEEILAGKMPQVLIGSVLKFPIREIGVNIDNKSPLTADNSALDDFDLTLVYSIAPSAVSDLYVNKSRSFHAVVDGGVYLMYNYIATLGNNAAYKAVRKYISLELADKRELLEQEIREMVVAELEKQGLSTAINITLLQIRNIRPNAAILDSATTYVKAQNELRVKQTEVEIAGKEAERLRILSGTAQQSIAYRQVEAQLIIAEAIREGKVNTIVVPTDFKGFVNIPK